MSQDNLEQSLQEKYELLLGAFNDNADETIALRAKFETLWQVKTDLENDLHKERSAVRNIDSYATWTEQLWFISGPRKLAEKDFTVMGFGLAGETGEVMEILKKRVRDGQLDLDRLTKELGDVAYYWARICKAFGLKPSAVLAANVAKIEDRRARGVMRGNGDNR